MASTSYEILPLIDVPDSYTWTSPHAADYFTVYERLKDGRALARIDAPSLEAAWAYLCFVAQDVGAAQLWTGDRFIDLYDTTADLRLDGTGFGPSPVTVWTFVSECPIPDDSGPLLVDGEQPWAAYKTFRDSAVFTNKRLIVRDAQGLTGKKVEIYSLPYSAINMWSSENAGGMLDFNSEIDLWTRAGHVKITLTKGVDIRKLDHLISHAVLNG